MVYVEGDKRGFANVLFSGFGATTQAAGSGEQEGEIRPASAEDVYYILEAADSVAIVPGYGLEPLLKQEALDHLLEMSGPAFQSSKWQLGLEVLLEGLEQLLETVSLVDEGIQHGESDF